ncbi:MAG: VCBS repeat-containing protein [Candidatus Manganitrophus sp.]|nr:MAG: VCBS repeat-containing protein [Candidatus Manganitrophus sp.]WDT81597.1 MAG: VCBS repeat-containing protein [Candidatus Manganitrophus sp.]
MAVTAVMNGIGNVSFLLGDGAGGFSTPVLFPAETSPSGVVAVDLDGDMNLDLIVANSLTNEISLLSGNGDGTFDPPVSFSIGTDAFHRPVALVSEDFDEDGTPDLAAVNNESGSVSIFLNDGAGGFAAPTRFPVGLEPQGIEVGDFNGDGKPDLVIPNFRTAVETQSVTVYVGVGDGTFGPSLEITLGTSKNPVAAAAGYFDDDPVDPNALRDLVVVNRSGNSVSVLLGQ